MELAGAVEKRELRAQLLDSMDLVREHDLDLIQTAPTVRYRIRMKDGQETEIHSPGQLPNPDSFEELLELYARVNILTPTEFIGNVMQITADHRGRALREFARRLPGVLREV